jgi:hypothetical protein
MRNSTATLVPVDHDVARYPLSVRQRISAIVAAGGTVHRVEEIDPDTFIIDRTLPDRHQEVARA